MKVLLSYFNGGVQVQEEAGKISIVFDEALGGGDCKGIVSGKGGFVLDGEMGLQVGEKLLNSHLPAAYQPLALMIEGVANNAVKALE